MSLWPVALVLHRFRADWMVFFVELCLRAQGTVFSHVRMWVRVDFKYFTKDIWLSVLGTSTIMVFSSLHLEGFAYG